MGTSACPSIRRQRTRVMVFTCVFVCVGMDACMHVCMHASMHTCIYVCVQSFCMYQRAGEGEKVRKKVPVALPSEFSRSLKIPTPKIAYTAVATIRTKKVFMTCSVSVCGVCACACLCVVCEGAEGGMCGHGT